MVLVPSFFCLPPQAPYYSLSIMLSSSGQMISENPLVVSAIYSDLETLCKAAKTESTEGRVGLLERAGRILSHKRKTQDKINPECILPNEPLHPF